MVNLKLQLLLKSSWLLIMLMNNALKRGPDLVIQSDGPSTDPISGLVNAKVAVLFQKTGWTA